MLFSEELCALDTTSCLSVSPWEVTPKQVDLKHTLGSGSFGEVWKAVVSGLKGSSGETTVAVKKLKGKSFQEIIFIFKVSLLKVQSSPLRMH